MSTPGASSSSTPVWKNDVFLSFCGKDTRRGFTDHLHAALKRRGNIVFRDDEKLERGEPISQELLKAIPESQYAVVVISENYAFSKWCLIELTKIIECNRKKQLTVLPVFYHVLPSDVRKQNGSFAEAFVKHMEDKVDDEQREIWKDALKEVGSLSGWDVGERYESKIIEEICGNIFDGLNRNLPCISNDLVGIESQVEEMKNLLHMNCDDVRFVGICGMGGVGKTTLAEVTFNAFSSRFEASCFVSNVKARDLVDCQRQLLFKILEESVNFENTYDGTRLIAGKVRNRKVMIVLDDVNKEEQLEALARSYDWFGPGSRILMTSRDSQLLKRYANDIYEVELLDDDDALQLFSLKAFKTCYPDNAYFSLSKDIVSFADGLPLALKVFGSLLYGKTITAWEEALGRLKAEPNANILDKLKISFDDLSNTKRVIFRYCIFLQ